jgi:hypothetical protein
VSSASDDGEQVDDERVSDDRQPDDGERADDSHPADRPSAEPSRATFRWLPDGDDCPACGAAVERQWRDGDRFVCADCKEW